MPEISIDLRLKLDKMRKDLEKAKSDIKSALSGTVGTGKEAGGSGSVTSRVKDDQEKLGDTVRKTTRAIKDQKQAMLDAWRASLPKPVVSLSGRPAGDWKTYWKGAGPTLDQDQMSGGNDNTSGGTTATGANIPPPLPPNRSMMPNWYLAQAQASASAMGPLNATKGGGAFGSIGLAIAGVTAGMAGLRVAVGLVKYAFQTLIAPFRMLSRVFQQAADAARTVYNKQLQSGGLPGSFISQRSVLAQVMGVSEQEVYSYGDAVAYLSDKLRFATESSVETNRSLTAASWAIRIVSADIRAMTALFSNEFAPGIRQAFNAVHVAIADFGKTFAKLLAFTIKQALEMAATTLFGSGSLLMKAFFKYAPDPGKAPEPGVSSRRLETSTWERVGLILGGGVGRNYAAQTAKNTGKMVSILDAMKSGAIPMGGVKMESDYPQP